MKNSGSAEVTVGQVMRVLFMEPGGPWKNGYIESFNGKPRDELLSGEVSPTLTGAKILVEGWRQEHNRVRPHSAPGHRPPASEARVPLPLSL